MSSSFSTNWKIIWACKFNLIKAIFIFICSLFDSYIDKANWRSRKTVKKKVATLSNCVCVSVFFSSKRQLNFLFNLLSLKFSICSLPQTSDCNGSISSDSSRPWTLWCNRRNSTRYYTIDCRWQKISYIVRQRSHRRWQFADRYVFTIYVYRSLVR